MDDSTAKKKILVVDDTPANIAMLMEVLKSEYRVVPARDGERALKVAQSDNPPEMILLDIMMPEMDGFEVCRRLKEDEKTKNIPVIFVTGKTESDDVDRGMQLGAVDFIIKPIEPQVVLDKVKTHME